MKRKPRLIYTFYRSHEVWPEQDRIPEINVTVFDSFDFEDGCVEEFAVRWHDFGERGLVAQLRSFQGSWRLLGPAVKALQSLDSEPWIKGWGIQTPTVDGVTQAFLKAGFIDRTADMVRERGAK